MLTLFGAKSMWNSTARCGEAGKGLKGEWRGVCMAQQVNVLLLLLVEYEDKGGGSASSGYGDLNIHTYNTSTMKLRSYNLKISNRMYVCLIMFPFPVKF